MGSDIGRSEAVAPITNESLRHAEAGPPVDTSSEGNTEISDARANAQLEESATTSNPPANSTSHQPPSSPMMDLETDFPSGETSRQLTSGRSPFLYSSTSAPPTLIVFIHTWLTLSVCERAQNHFIRSGRHHSEE